jgi:hypothetical protein
MNYQQVKFYLTKIYPPTDTEISQFSIEQMPIPYYSKIRFDIILPSSSSELSRFKKFCNRFSLQYASYIKKPS